MASLTRHVRFVPWLALAAVLVAPAAAPVPPVYGRQLQDHQVKAAYLYRFGRFVTWPPDAPAARGDSFVICVLGDDPFGASLDEVAAGAALDGKPVLVRRVARVEQSASCHTLFISASERARIARTLQALARRPVLTVSDAPQFAEQGGIIGFFLEDNRVRFTVNLTAARQAGLQLNSDLLRVAASVLTGGTPEDR